MLTIYTQQGGTADRAKTPKTPPKTPTKGRGPPGKKGKGEPDVPVEVPGKKPTALKKRADEEVAADTIGVAGDNVDVAVSLF